MDFWEVVLVFHLLGMAFFVGGQLFLATAVVPAAKGTEYVAPIARRFGYGSLIALAVLILSGAMMAGHLNLWSEPLLHTKMTLILILVGLTLYHMRNGHKAWLHPVIFLLSLAVVFLGVAL